MNGKPKSYRALLLAAAHCTHPDTDAADSCLLQYLAQYSAQDSGKNSHPGNHNLCQTMRLSRSAVNSRLSKNIARGLIERTEVGDGRSKASVYRICLESSYYPDQTPSGELLIEEVSCLDRTDNQEVSCQVPESVLPAAAKCPVRSEEVSCQVPESVLPGQAHNKYPTKAQQIQNTHTQTEKPEGVCVSSYEQASKYLHTEFLTTQWKPDQKAKLEQLISKHGLDAFLLVTDKYWQMQDPAYFDKTMFKWSALIENFDGLLHKLHKENQFTAEIVEHRNYCRWREDNPAEAKRLQDESNDRQIREHAAAEEAARQERQRKFPVSEGALEDMFTPEELACYQGTMSAEQFLN